MKAPGRRTEPKPADQPPRKDGFPRLWRHFNGHRLEITAEDWQYVSQGPDALLNYGLLRGAWADTLRPAPGAGPRRLQGWVVGRDSFKSYDLEAQAEYILADLGLASAPIFWFYVDPSGECWACPETFQMPIENEGDLRQVWRVELSDELGGFPLCLLEEEFFPRLHDQWPLQWALTVKFYLAEQRSRRWNLIKRREAVQELTDMPEFQRLREAVQSKGSLEQRQGFNFLTSRAWLKAGDNFAVEGALLGEKLAWIVGNMHVQMHEQKRNGGKPALRAELIAIITEYIERERKFRPYMIADQLIEEASVGKTERAARLKALGLPADRKTLGKRISQIARRDLNTQPGDW